MYFLRLTLFLNRRVSSLDGDLLTGDNLQSEVGIIAYAAYSSRKQAR